MCLNYVAHLVYILKFRIVEIKGAIFMASLTITRMTTLNGKGKRIRKIKMQLEEMNKMQVDSSKLR